MKQMVCSQFGGPQSCVALISGETAEEIMVKGLDHLEKAHPEIMEQMDEMPVEAKNKWISDFQQKFEVYPEI